MGIDTINVGIIGYGYWGPNLVRNFVEVSQTKVISICDRQPENLAKVQVQYPHIQVTTKSQERRSSELGQL